MSSLIAPSTIAMSVYNIMTLIEATEVTPSMIFDVVRRIDAGIDLGDIERAVVGLLERGRILPAGEGVRLADLAKRRVKWRDRDGDGWNDWMVQDAKLGAIPLEDAIKGA